MGETPTHTVCLPCLHLLINLLQSSTFSSSRFLRTITLPMMPMIRAAPSRRIRLPSAPRQLQLQCLPPRRTLIPPPRANSGPLMERRSDRELPPVNTIPRWLRTLPVFVVVVGAAALAIFNYQKSSSSVVSSTLYALRMSPKAREILGDEIYFSQKIPWISGQMDQLHGRIDISFWVKGTKGQGKMRFRSTRPDRMSFVCSFVFISLPHGRF